MCKERQSTAHVGSWVKKHPPKTSVIFLVMGKALQRATSRHPAYKHRKCSAGGEGTSFQCKILLLTVADNIYIRLEECPV